MLIYNKYIYYNSVANSDALDIVVIFGYNKIGLVLNHKHNDK